MEVTMKVTQMKGRLNAALAHSDFVTEWNETKVAYWPPAYDKSMGSILAGSNDGEVSLADPAIAWLVAMQCQIGNAPKGAVKLFNDLNSRANGYNSPRKAVSIYGFLDPQKGPIIRRWYRAEHVATRAKGIARSFGLEGGFMSAAFFANQVGKTGKIAVKLVAERLSGLTFHSYREARSCLALCSIAMKSDAVEIDGSTLRATGVKHESLDLYLDEQARPVWVGTVKDGTPHAFCCRPESWAYLSQERLKEEAAAEQAAFYEAESNAGGQRKLNILDELRVFEDQRYRVEVVSFDPNTLKATLRFSEYADNSVSRLIEVVAEKVIGTELTCPREGELKIETWEDYNIRPMLRQETHLEAGAAFILYKWRKEEEDKGCTDRYTYKKVLMAPGSTARVTRYGSGWKNGTSYNNGSHLVYA